MTITASKKIIWFKVLIGVGVVVLGTVATSSPAHALFVGTQVLFGGASGTRAEINFDKNSGSYIYDDWDLHVQTDDRLYLNAPQGVILSDPNLLFKGETAKIDLGGTTKITRAADLKIETDDYLYLTGPIATYWDTELVQFAGGYTSLVIDFNFGGSKITNADDLTIETNDNLYLKAPGFVDVQSDLRVGGGYGSTGTQISSAGNIQANGNLTVDETSTLGGQVTIGGGTGDTGVTITAAGAATFDGAVTIGGATRVNNTITLQNGETVANSTDDTIVFQGAGGDDNTDLTLNLDGTYPSFRSGTDTTIGFGENVYVYWYGGGTQAKLYLYGPGNENNLTMYHNDTDGYLDTSTGDLILQPSGNVGIGTTEPGSNKLYVNGNARVDGSVYVGGTSYVYANRLTNSGWNSSDITVAAYTGYDVVLQPTSGNVGIGTASPGYTLEVSGTGYFSGYLNSSTAGLATIVNAGACADTQGSVNGALCVDSTNGRIYYRYGGGWHYSSQDAGFQIPNFETEGMTEGDYVIGVVDGTLSDGALHGVYTLFDKEGLEENVSDLSSRVKVLEEVEECRSFAAVGTAAIKEGETSVDVLSDKATKASLIFLTPEASTSGQTLYVKEKREGGGFIVGIENALEYLLQFNWMIVN